ncbi:hypothetical protein B0H11DRAFT_1739632 [Mycena galericulata]|nr:hypothetical protein B0H11DRAFT_1739632 [Mycena galericulata]
MSLTLLWNGETHVFDAHDPTILHYYAKVETRVNTHVYIIHSVREPCATAILKVARDTEEIGALEKEASLYENELKPLIGKYVPDYFGIFYGTVLGTPFSCMLLEFCCSGVPTPPEEKNRKVMLAACALHQAGLSHNDLLGGRHFVDSNPDIKIVDFSKAMPHHCTGGTPLLHPGMGANPMGCPELMALEAAYGLFSGGKFPTTNRMFPRPFAEGMPLHRLGQRFAGMMARPN